MSESLEGSIPASAITSPSTSHSALPSAEAALGSAVPQGPNALERGTFKLDQLSRRMIKDIPSRRLEKVYDKVSPFKRVEVPNPILEDPAYKDAVATISARTELSREVTDAINSGGDQEVIDDARRIAGARIRGYEWARFAKDHPDKIDQVIAISPDVKVAIERYNAEQARLEGMKTGKTIGGAVEAPDPTSEGPSLTVASTEGGEVGDGSVKSAEGPIARNDQELIKLKEELQEMISKGANDHEINAKQEQIAALEQFGEYLKSQADSEASKTSSIEPSGDSSEMLAPLPLTPEEANELRSLREIMPPEIPDLDQIKRRDELGAKEKIYLEFARSSQTNNEGKEPVAAASASDAAEETSTPAGIVPESTGEPRLKVVSGGAANEGTADVSAPATEAGSGTDEPIAAEASVGAGEASVSEVQELRAEVGELRAALEAAASERASERALEKERYEELMQKFEKQAEVNEKLAQAMELLIKSQDKANEKNKDSMLKRASQLLGLVLIAAGLKAADVGKEAAVQKAA